MAKKNGAVSAVDISGSVRPGSHDIYSPDKRSEIMSRVQGQDTKPELLLRSLLHSYGYRFRLHRKDLPGRPDIVLPRYRAVIFVHGCFWHQHNGCKKATIPVNNREKWEAKLSRNIERDDENQRMLREQGWQVLTVWECELKNKDLLESKLASVLPDLKERMKKVS